MVCAVKLVVSSGLVHSKSNLNPSMLATALSTYDFGVKSSLSVGVPGDFTLPSFNTSNALLLVMFPFELKTPFPTAKAVSLDISLAMPTAPAPLLPLVKSCP